MQREINNEVHLGQTVTPFESISKSSAIDKIALDFDSPKVEKIKKAYIKTGVYYADVARYIPGMLDVIFQGMIQKTSTIKQPAHLSYKDKETLDFELILNKNYYTNMKNVHVCFPIRFKKLTNAAANLVADLMPKNNFFTLWVKEIDITKYGTNKSLIPTATPQEIYRYSESMLKHLPKDPLKMIQNDILFSKKAVAYPANCGRRIHNSDDATQITDDNVDDRQHDLTPRIYVLHKITIALKFMSYINQKLLPSYQTALNICLTYIENFGKKCTRESGATGN